MVLSLADGSEIVSVSRPAQGTRHDVVFGRDGHGGPEVVVKLERIAGALSNERVALEWMTPRSRLAPRLRRVSETYLPDGLSVACLVMDRVPGVAPQDDAGWRRMGTALAQLSSVAWEGSALTVHDPQPFLDAHATRARDLETPLRAAIGQIADWATISRPPVGSCALVFTHGDPGPGNFLDAGSGGHLIDFEAAQVAPRGLDLARAMFIALLGSGPEGFVARDHAARARAVAAGYLDDATPRWQPTPRELRGWLTVAAVQFAHRRQQRAGQPGVQPAAHAIAALAGALTSDDWQPTRHTGTRSHQSARSL